MSLVKREAGGHLTVRLVILDRRESLQEPSAIESMLRETGIPYSPDYQRHRILVDLDGDADLAKELTGAILAEPWSDLSNSQLRYSIVGWNKK